MLTFDIPKEILVPRITQPSFLNDVAFEFIRRLWKNCTLEDNYILNDGKRYRILNKMQIRYPSRYVRYGKVSIGSEDGYIICAVTQNYGEFYLFGMAHALQITPDGKTEFYLDNLKTFGLWNSVDCKRRGV